MSTRLLPSLGTIAIVGVACAFLCAAPGVLAQSNTTQSKTESLSHQRLKKLDQEIEQRETSVQDIEDRVDQVRKDYARLQKQSVRLAREIQTLSKEVEDTQEHLIALRGAEDVAARELRLQSADMAEALAAMQKLSQTPATILIAKPEGIDTMARTALLFDAILPSLNAQADLLRQKIAKVEAVRADIRADNTRLVNRQSALTIQRAEMTQVMAQKKQQQRQMSKELAAERRRITKLTKEAKTLGELIDRLGAPIQSVPMQSGLGQNEQGQSGRVREEYADIGRSLQSLPFRTAKGKLSLPAPGVVVSLFNQQQADGQKSKGIRMETTLRAQVVSLWDGNIVFAGPFRDYGQLLIISHGQGYHSLLAGMSQIEVDIAQWVLAGEPVGLMFGLPARPTDNEEKTGNSRPRLYIELRQDGRSIDPLPWIAVSQRKVKG